MVKRYPQTTNKENAIWCMGNIFSSFFSRRET
jgi:hypothetical protein